MVYPPRADPFQNQAIETSIILLVWLGMRILEVAGMQLLFCVA